MLRGIATALLALTATTASAQELTIAAASDLQAVFPALADRFERETGRRVLVTFGSSGNFFSQIQNGAPFDLFFSADIDYPRRLDGAGLGEAGSLREYATGRLVVWARRDSGVDVRQGLRALSGSNVRRVAIANPEHAPYGRAAVAALQHERLYDSVRGKLVLGENIAQAAQFVASGNAQAGIIALSLALSPGLKDQGSYADIPEAFHPPLQQAAIIVRASRNKDAARQFMAFLGRPATIALLEASGFRVASRSPR